MFRTFYFSSGKTVEWVIIDAASAMSSKADYTSFVEVSDARFVDVPFLPLRLFDFLGASEVFDSVTIF